MADVTQNFSQLLLTYGPGAMLDLPDHAVVVAGLQDWNYSGLPWRPVEEERLVALLRRQLGAKLSPSFSGLRAPPKYDEDRHHPNAPGVEVRVFPTWFLVDEPGAPESETAETPSPGGGQKRRKMVEFRDLTPVGGMLSYRGDGKRTGVNPIRFVGACAKGHLQDIDWRALAHRNGDRACRKILYWVERGVSSDPSDISVQCACGATVTLVDLYKPHFLGRCECFSPWLTPRRIAEDCDKELRLLPRSATNTYFSQIITVISLVKSEDRLRQAIAEHASTLAWMKGMPNFTSILRANPQTKDAFKDFSDEDIERAFAAAEGPNAVNENPRLAEFDMMASGAPTIGSDAAGSFFFAETLPPENLAQREPWASFLKGVVKVHRLREVTCLYGFTRLEPPPTLAEDELDEIQLAVDGADLARSVEWLPAIEQFGEGLFLHVNPGFLKVWAERPENLAKAANLKDRENRDAERFKREPKHRGMIYWALHSLSHALMSELSLECGYPLSSLKERVYSSGAGQSDRFGILIYTSTSGGQGTLGGLSNMAERAIELLQKTVDSLRLCSNDPVCAEHSDGNTDHPLQGAACHACLLVPETTCEARNARLDRGLLVRTVVDGDAALF